MDYFKILGLEEGATQSEIKRAYFSLVRRYSPEEDPEKFREIREAYEYLQKKGTEEGPVFPELPDPLAKKLLLHIEDIEKRRDNELTRDACEEALHLFPNETRFRYLLAAAQRRAGNTGKAVKNCELLVKQEPDNKWFWRELAMSYLERGYSKKAFGAFEKAYELGCRDNDFILMFSVECEDYGKYDTGVKILLELVSQKKRWEREQVPEILDAYSGLLSMNDGIEGKDCFMEILDGFYEFIKAHTIFLEENLFIVFTIVQFLLDAIEFHKESIPLTGDVISVVEKACRNPEYKEGLQGMRGMYTFACLDNDDRFSETVRRGAEVVFGNYFFDSQIRKFAMLDTKLCMIEEREEILPQLEIIEKEYPRYYEEIHQFAEQLRTGDNLEYLKSTLLGQYARFARQTNGGYYFKKYPKEKERVFGKVINRGTTDEPYVRSGKKIGRNDPCPCGSGKKYKHCCGR